MSYTKEQLEKMRAEQAAYFERLRAQGEEERIAKASGRRIHEGLHYAIHNGL